jgi:nucleoside-diphosphate-sugar epimerase
MSIKVAVLGSDGFLGKFVTKQLRTIPNFTVLPLHRRELDFLNENSVFSWLAKNTPDCIVNCASVGGNENLDSQDSSIIRDNVNIVLNFYNHKSYFKRFINIGSGAEYDKTTDINNVTEQEVFERFPKDSYGYSKNIISRFLHPCPFFYTLRLFGCFDHTERPFRLFSRYVAYPGIEIEDKKFDYISAYDFFRILLVYLKDEGSVLPSTLNCVYEEKLYLSEILRMFELGEPNVVSHSSLSYTASGDRLKKFLSYNKLELGGLQQGIQYFKMKV